MKKTFTVACMVATLTVFAAAMLTGCKKDENDFVRDRVGATQHTTTVHDTIPPVLDTTIVVVEDTHTYSMRIRQWHHHWLGVSAGYLVGEDSVVLAKYEGATLLQTWRGTARHRGTATLSVGTTAYPASVVGDSCWLAAQGGGVYSGNMSGNSVVMTLGPQAIQGPVVLNGFDWTAYLVAHEAIGQRVRFDADGNARGFIIDADGRAAGVITAPYTTDTTPDTTRTETSRDTSWNGCGQVTNTVRNGAASHTINHTIVRTGTVTIHYNVDPFTESHTVSETTHYVSSYSVSGSALTTAQGTTASFSGNSLTIGGATLTITPGAQAWCTLNYNSATLTSNGFVVSFTYNGTTGTVTIPVTWQTPRHETSRDTNWNGCGSLVSSSLTSVLIQHTLARTGVVTVNYNIAPLTETFTVSESTMYYTQYMVSGSANPSAIGTTANFTGNSVTIGGVTLVLTPGAQPWCNLSYTTATLTSNGLVVSFSYNGGTGTVTISVPWQTPDPIFTSVLAAAATDSYTHQIFSQSSYRHTFVCVVAQIGTNYRFYWAELAANMVRADFDSVSITAAEANFYVNHLSDGYYPAMVYDHNNHTTLYRGVVTSVELTTGWQQTYRLAPSNSLAYVMGGSSWTMAGDTGRNAVRGVMNASGQIVADGITVQLY